MKDDKSMQWTIEPTLREFMDRKMVIARATFAKDSYFSRLYCRLTLRRLDADKTSDSQRPAVQSSDKGDEWDRMLRARQQ